MKVEIGNLIVKETGLFRKLAAQKKRKSWRDDLVDPLTFPHCSYLVNDRDALRLRAGNGRESGRAREQLSPSHYYFPAFALPSLGLGFPFPLVIRLIRLFCI
jgi:hypothetical protein